MKPVPMICKHEPENGSYGDCFRACIASLLELPSEQVPHFMGEGYRDGQTMQRELNEFLAKFDLCYYGILQKPEDPWRWQEWLACGWNPYYIWSGHSGIADHSVIGRAGEVVHDPAPSQRGIIGPMESGDYGIGFLMHIGSKQIIEKP